MSPTARRTPLRLGVVFENTVGHVTFARTLALAISASPDVTPTFFPVNVPPGGLVDRLSLMEHNWTLHSSVDTRLLFLRRTRNLDALLFHTQTLTQLSTGVIRRIPSVISLDATPVNFDEVGLGYGHYPDSDRREAFKRWVLRRPLRAAARLIAWSDWVRGSLVGDYGIDAGRITVIPAGTDTSRHLALRSERRPGPPRVLFVGGAFDRKGGPLLLEALAELNVPLHLDVVTQDRPRPVDGMHVHTGLHPGDPAIDRLYADADVFVLPTRGDASPHVILEAMAAGLPVIATRLGAIGEIVRDGETGLLIDRDDRVALVAGLRRLCGDLDLAGRMGAMARERARAQFDAQRNVDRVLDVVREIAAMPPVGS